MTQSDTFTAMRACIKTMLVYPHNFKWTVQGFGMMRTYLPGPVYDKQFRLNVWDRTLAVPNVSVVHDHPWAFKSWIINGRFLNLRFVEDFFNGDGYNYMVIKTGEGGGPSGNRLKTNLRPLNVEIYHTGDVYEQEPTEIHCSLPDDSTVTLNDRTIIGDGEHARVFWMAGGDWVDAEPREATEKEVYGVAYRALEKWK